MVRRSRRRSSRWGVVLVATLNPDFGGYIHIADEPIWHGWVVTFCGQRVEDIQCAEPEQADCPVCAYRLETRAGRAATEPEGGVRPV